MAFGARAKRRRPTRRIAENGRRILSAVAEIGEKKRSGEHDAKKPTITMRKNNNKDDTRHSSDDDDDEEV